MVMYPLPRHQAGGPTPSIYVKEAQTKVQSDKGGKNK